MFSKKLFAVFSVILLCCTVFSPGVARADINAYKTPVDIANWVDHTYGCLSGSTNCYPWPSWSAGSGGTYVTGGYSTPEQVNTAACYTFCNMGTYGVDAVCHQHTNRVLYAIGKELDTSVRGYSASKAIWGAKGWSWYACYNYC